MYPLVIQLDNTEQWISKSYDAKVYFRTFSVRLNNYWGMLFNDISKLVVQKLICEDFFSY